MTEKEIKKRKAEQGKHHRQVLIEKAIFTCAVVVILVVVIITATGKLKRSSDAAAKSGEVIAVVTAAPTPIGSVTSAPSVQKINNYVPKTDRSDFAVNPALPCGTNEISDEKVVYLTLDDGPSYLTKSFLDLLDEYNIKATFFVTGQNPDYYYMIKEAYDRGHTIGLHTYSHDYSIYSSVDAYFDDLGKIGEVVKEQIGYVPCFIRFPGGSANNISADYCVGIMTTLSQEVQKRGYQYFDWNCSSGDGGSCTDPKQLAAAATSSEWNTTVLLSHDGSGKEATLEAMRTIIEYYLDNGYEFRPIDRTAYTSHQTIFN